MVRMVWAVSALAFFGLSWAEEIFPVHIVDKDPARAEKLARHLVVIAIENGMQDHVIVCAQFGGLYEWTADLSVRGKLYPLNRDKADLLYSGKRIDLGDAFTKDDTDHMTVTNFVGILK